MTISALKGFNLFGSKGDKWRLPACVWEGSSEGGGSMYPKILLP